MNLMNKIGIKRNKVPLVQRFKQASIGGKLLLILKFIGLFSIVYFFTPEKTRKIAYKTELGNHIEYYEDTGEVISVYRPENNPFKNASH